MQGQPIRSHRELKVWNKGMDAAMAVFEVTKTFPARKKFSPLTPALSPLRGEGVAPTQIFEARRTRRYSAAFVSKLNDAEGEAGETQTHVEIARRCQYLSDAKAAELDGIC
jgi:four helix bundle protein